MASSKVQIDFKANTDTAVKNTDALKDSLAALARSGGGTQGALVASSKQADKLAKSASSAAKAAQNLNNQIAAPAQADSASAKAMQDTEAQTKKAAEAVKELAKATAEVKPVEVKAEALEEMTSSNS